MMTNLVVIIIVIIFKLFVLDLHHIFVDGEIRFFFCAGTFPKNSKY